MAWVKVAEGTNFADLKMLVEDIELQKGERMRIIMNTKIPGAAVAFDIAPNWGWPAPEGMSIVDIWGEGGVFGTQGIVEMEADPAWLVAVWAFMKAHWVAITIAGFVLGAIITSIVALVWVAEKTGIPWWIWAIGGVAVAYLVLKKPVQKAAPVVVKIATPAIARKLSGR